MKFEFHREKSEANQHKHGIRLEDATQIWESVYLEVTARTVNEQRWMAIGKIGEKLYVCVYTRRGEAIRLISCRRADEKEASLYYEHFKESKDKT